MNNLPWTIEPETINGITDAIREKEGSAAPIFTNDIKARILALDKKPEQTKSFEVTANGTYTILPDEGKTLSSVEVIANNPYQDKWDQIINRTITQVTAEDLADVTKINNYAFAGCINLKTCAMPAHLTSIGTRAFYGCSNLGTGGVTLSIPAGITSIGEHAFGYCGSLTTIRFKGTPSSIAANVFTNSAGITHIYVPWAKGAVANSPWGAANATIHYNSAV